MPKKIIRKQQTILTTEAKLEYEDLFFSVTNLKGEIDLGNDTFFRIAEYARDEMIGQQHNIIRHPWMPRAVFRLLWQYLQDGKDIAAYVVNRTKSGKFYWVFGMFSSVVDNDTGKCAQYLSVRIKPSSERKKIVEGLYRDMLAIEEASDTESAMDASTAHLVKTLGTLDYSDYDTFMRDALRDEMHEYMKHNIFREMAARHRPRGSTELQRCQRIMQKVVGLLECSLRDLYTAGDALQGIQTLLEDARSFFALTKDSSMNVAIASGKLDKVAARSLGPVVFELIEIAATGEKILDMFEEMLAGLVSAQEGSLYSANKALAHSGCLLKDIDVEVARDGECGYAGKVANVTLRDLNVMAGAMHAYLNNAAGLSDLIGRKLGYVMILGRTLCAQGIVQAETCGATGLLNTLTELQKEIIGFEDKLDQTAQAFRSMTDALHAADVSVAKSSESFETIDEILGMVVTS